MILSADFVTFIAYSVALFMVISSILCLKAHLQERTSEGMDYKVACLHVLVVLSFFLGQVVYTVIVDSVVAWCLRNGKHREQELRGWLSLAWCIKMICVFVGCMTILYMFSRYAVAQQSVQST